MKLTFTKRDGKYDELLIRRNNGEAEKVMCPKQGILPHDMIHYAVESVLSHRGFFSLVRDGQSADFTAMGGDEEEAIERLVETFQAELWSARVPTADLLSTYEQACDARGHRITKVRHADIHAIRSRLGELSERWSALAPNETMTLTFDPAE